MSVLEDLGARLRAVSDELPTGLVTVALQRLSAAADLLTWVRRESVDPMGVPQLANATEHAEHAVAALRLAQDAVAQYLAVLGLGTDAGPPPGGDDRAAGADEPPGGTRPPALPSDPAALADGERRRPPADATPPPERLGPWWQRRVAELTGEEPPPEPPRDGSRDAADLLRRVAAGVRTGDRARLGRDLHAADASVGLRLSAVAPPVLHRLAVDLLGHEPRPDDLPRLRTAAGGRVRSLLPGTPPAVLDTLLARVCRASSTPDGRAHPADSAVTASVLTGVLLARLGRDAATLDPAAPESPRRPADA
jgi:hypothetical protein